MVHADGYPKYVRMLAAAIYMAGGIALGVAIRSVPGASWVGLTLSALVAGWLANWSA